MTRDDYRAMDASQDMADAMAASDELQSQHLSALACWVATDIDREMTGKVLIMGKVFGTKGGFVVDRPEAIAALASLPATTRISVIECDERLSMETMNNIKALVGTVFPANKAIVLDKGLRLKVAESEP